jgi:hypothetical protein
VTAGVIATVLTNLAAVVVFAGYELTGLVNSAHRRLTGQSRRIVGLAPAALHDCPSPRLWAVHIGWSWHWRVPTGTRWLCLVCYQAWELRVISGGFGDEFRSWCAIGSPADLWVSHIRSEYSIQKGGGDGEPSR